MIWFPAAKMREAFELWERTTRPDDRTLWGAFYGGANAARPYAAAPSPAGGRDDLLHKTLSRLKAHIEAVQAGRKASVAGEAVTSAPILDCINELPEIVRHLEAAEFEIDAAFEKYEDAASPAGGGVEALRIATVLHKTVEGLIYGLPKYLDARGLTDEESLIREAFITLDVTAHQLAALSHPVSPEDRGSLPAAAQPSVPTEEPSSPVVGLTQWGWRLRTKATERHNAGPWHWQPQAMDGNTAQFAEAEPVYVVAPSGGA